MLLQQPRKGIGIQSHATFSPYKFSPSYTALHYAPSSTSSTSNGLILSIHSTRQPYYAPSFHYTLTSSNELIKHRLTSKSFDQCSRFNRYNWNQTNYRIPICYHLAPMFVKGIVAHPSCGLLTLLRFVWPYPTFTSTNLSLYIYLG